MGDVDETGGTHRLHGEGHVRHGSECSIKLLVKAHEPHGVEGFDDRKTPAVQASVNQREREPCEAKDGRTYHGDSWKAEVVRHEVLSS